MQIFVTYISTPLGELFAAANCNSIVYLQFYENEDLIQYFLYYLKNQNPEIQQKETDLLKNLKLQINEYFERKRQNFLLPTSYYATPFQHKIWRLLQEVSFGNQYSYKEFAEKNGETGKTRAVAYAISRNPILIINPCHRIIGSKGNLTGYAGKIWRKKALLDLESATVQMSLF